jgi:hypothetical protein
MVIMDAGIVENLKYSRAAAEANEYSSFVRQAALRIFSTDPEQIESERDSQWQCLRENRGNYRG